MPFLANLSGLLDRAEAYAELRKIDPAILLAPWEVIEERTRDVLTRGRTAEGHVFNLGHGVLPETDPDVLARLADLVHAESARALS